MSCEMRVGSFSFNLDYQFYTPELEFYRALELNCSHDNIGLSTRATSSFEAVWIALFRYTCMRISR